MKRKETQSCWSANSNVCFIYLSIYQNSLFKDWGCYANQTWEISTQQYRNQDCPWRFLSIPGQFVKKSKKSTPFRTTPSEWAITKRDSIKESYIYSNVKRIESNTESIQHRIRPAAYIYSSVRQTRRIIYNCGQLHIRPTVILYARTYKERSAKIRVQLIVGK